MCQVSLVVKYTWVSENLGHSFTFFVKMGIYQVPGGAEKGGYFAYTYILCHI